jgi:nicotinamide mononucleotide (NMN) deamidase PncC
MTVVGLLRNFSQDGISKIWFKAMISYTLFLKTMVQVATQPLEEYGIISIVINSNKLKMEFKFRK